MINFLQQGVEFLCKGFFGDETDGFVDRLVGTFEEKYGGDVTDAEECGEVAAFVHVGGADKGASFVFFFNFFYAGGKRFARTAPSGAEVNHDGFALSDNGFEVFFCYFHDIIV